MPFVQSGQRPPEQSSRPLPRLAGVRRAAGCLALLAVSALPLAASGEEELAAATVTPGPAVGDAATPAATTGVAPATSDSPAASPGAGDGPLTLGVLADRMDAAWAGVRSFRAVVVTGPADAVVRPAAASPAASPQARAGIREVTIEAILPDRQRQLTRVDGAVWLEALAADGRVFVRGPLARSVRPEAGGDAWVEIDPTALDPAGEVGQTLGGLVGPIPSPGATIPPNLRAQEPRPLGAVEVAGRTCQAYAAASTTEIGGRIDLTYAIAADGLPCFVESASGAAAGRITYEAYNLPLVIEPPANALPAASPAAPATPAGRD